MAKYRCIYSCFWKDDKVFELFTSNMKLLFLYLLSNENAKQIGIYRVYIREIAFLTGIDENEVIDILDKFENEFKIIKYSKKTKEICILNWAYYNLNNVGGKPIMDCIKSELRMVKDRSLIPEVLKGIKKDDIRQLFIDAIKEGDKEIYESREVKSTNKFKDEDISLYAKPSEEQLRRARELYS